MTTPVPCIDASAVAARRLPRARAAGPGLGAAVVPGLLVLNGSVIAGIYTVAKVARAEAVGPLGILAWQVLFAAAVLVVVARLAGQWPAFTAATVRYAAIAGVLGIAGPNLLTFTALAHLPAGLVGVIGALAPVFTYLLALALGGERWRATRAVGVLLGLVGVLLVLAPRAALPVPGALGWGLLALAAPALLAGGNVYRSLAWPPGLPPLGAAALLLLLQAAWLVPLALASGQWVVPSSPSSARDLALLAAGALTAVFYLGAFELQKRGGPVVTGQLGYVITVASLALGALVFGERPPAITVVAVTLVFLGIALVNRREDPAGGRR